MPSNNRPLYFYMINQLTIDHPTDNVWFSTRSQCERLGIQFHFNEKQLYVCLTGLNKKTYNGIFGMDPATYTQLFYDLELDSFFSHYGYTADYAFYFNDGSKRILILFSPTDCPVVSPEKLVENVTEYIQSFYEERLFCENTDYPNTSAFAPVHGGLSEIHPAFERVNALHHLSFFVSSPTVFTQQWFDQHKKPLDFQTLIHLLREFDSALLAGTPARTNLILHDLFMVNLKSSLSRSLCEDALLYLKGTFELYFTVYGIDLHDQFDILFKLSNYPSIYRCHEQMQLLLAQLHEKMHETTISSESIIKAIYYIRQHYREPSLSLTDVANYVNVNQNYLSSLFRQQTSLTIRQFITNERLCLAKSLLTTTDQSIQDVAVECGFIDTNYFCQVFRSNADVSPQAYRKTHSSLTL